MKNILNYATVQDFIEAEGPQMGARGYVTSITPGVAYVGELKLVAYNNNKRPEITLQAINSLNSEIITSCTFADSATCQDIWNIVASANTKGGTEPAPPYSGTYRAFGRLYDENGNHYGNFMFTWNEENYSKPVCEKVQMFAESGVKYEENPPEQPKSIPPFYDSTTGKFAMVYYGYTIKITVVKYK